MKAKHIGTYKVIRAGRGLVISLPSTFAKLNGITSESHVDVNMVGGNSTLLIIQAPRGEGVEPLPTAINED